MNFQFFWEVSIYILSLFQLPAFARRSSILGGLEDTSLDEENQPKVEPLQIHRSRPAALPAQQQKTPPVPAQLQGDLHRTTCEREKEALLPAEQQETSSLPAGPQDVWHATHGTQRGQGSRPFQQRVEPPSSLATEVDSEQRHRLPE